MLQESMTFDPKEALSVLRGLTSTCLTALMLDGGYALWFPFTMQAHHGLSGTRRLPPTALSTATCSTLARLLYPVAENLNK
eukprot:1578927-Amphidinium_carterae.1